MISRDGWGVLVGGIIILYEGWHASLNIQKYHKIVHLYPPMSISGQMFGNSECWVKLPLGANPKLPRVRPISTGTKILRPQNHTQLCTCTAYSKLTTRQTCPKCRHSNTNYTIGDTVMQENSWTFTLKHENSCFRESDPQNCLSHKEHSLTFRILYGLVRMEYYCTVQLHCAVHGSEILQWKIPDWGRNRKIWRKKKIYRRTLLYCTVQHGWESLQWEIDFLWRHSSPQRCILHIIKSRRGGIQI